MKSERYWSVDTRATARDPAINEPLSGGAHFVPQPALQVVTPSIQFPATEKSRQIELINRKIMFELCRYDERLFFVDEYPRVSH